MSTTNSQVFTTFKEAVTHILKREDNDLPGRRNFQQDLADAMGIHKTNLSHAINDERKLTDTVLGRIEVALGWKFNKQPDGWTAHRLKDENLSDIGSLLSAGKRRLPADNNEEQSQDDPRQLLQVAARLIQEYLRST